MDDGFIMEKDKLTVLEMKKNHPYLMDFFDINALPEPKGEESIEKYFSCLPYDVTEDTGMTGEVLKKRFYVFIKSMEELRREEMFSVESLSILGGRDKNGDPEQAEIHIHKGEIVSIVGPTGAGKSRLLEDIEWMAQGDTPTGRSVLINGNVPPEEWRFSLEYKLVAQLSQNMRFVMDTSVGEFVRLHAKSRMVDDVKGKTERIILEANLLSGEEFLPETPLTSLSGGQSRALMIADTAILSRSPIVLIDEIENAGINRNEALKLLARENKIVIAATHDPLLALTADIRVIIQNGGIFRVMERDDVESPIFSELVRIDEKLMRWRNQLRRGERLTQSLETD